jgi:hypothetical protein
MEAGSCLCAGLPLSFSRRSSTRHKSHGALQLTCKPHRDKFTVLKIDTLTPGFRSTRPSRVVKNIRLEKPGVNGTPREHGPGRLRNYVLGNEMVEELTPGSSFSSEKFPLGQPPHLRKYPRIRTGESCTFVPFFPGRRRRKECCSAFDPLKNKVAGLDPAPSRYVGSEGVFSIPRSNSILILLEHATIWGSRGLPRPLISPDIQVRSGFFEKP